MGFSVSRESIIRNLRHILPLMREYKSSILLGALLVLLTNSLFIFGPRILGMAIDDLAAGMQNHSLNWYIGALMALAILSAITRFGMRRILIGTSRRVEKDLRELFFHRLLGLSPRFFATHQTGDIMSRATQDIENVRLACGPGMMYSMDTLILGSFGLSMMLSMSLRLSLVVIVMLPIVSIIVYNISRRVHRLTTLSQEQFGRLSNLVQESTAGIRVIQAYARESHMAGKFDEVLEEYRRIQMSLIRTEAAFRPLMGALFALSQGILLWIAGNDIVAGNLQLGDYVAFATYTSMLAWPTIAIGWVTNLLQRGDAGMKRLDGIIREEDVLHEGRADKPESGHIQINNLSFAYDTGPTILDHIDVDIPAGSILGIVGETGSGKSTLLKCICRELDPLSGSIRLDGTAIAELSLDDLRTAMAVVPQDAFLFSETLRNNVRFGRLDASDALFDRSSEISRIDRDIPQLADGWESSIGERGITLSGGQKQRSTIARAVLMEPAVLILDDCLSAVDNQTEEEIIAELRHYMKGRTTIIASHRLSALQTADHIIVLNNGRIGESGTHAQLLKTNGVYADLYHKQQLEEQLSANGETAHEN